LMPSNSVLNIGKFGALGGLEYSVGDYSKGVDDDEYYY